MKRPKDYEIIEIVRAGTLAPSADNRHQVCFQETPTGLAIWADDALRDCAERHRVLLSLLSLGAIVENVVLQTKALGVGVDARFLPDWRDSGRLAMFDWTSAAVSKDALVEAIPFRHTNRRFFHGPPMASAELEILESEVTAIDGVSLRWLDGDVERKTAQQLVLLAEAERFRRERLHRELFSAIRFDVGWKQTCEEGLPPGALEVEPWLRGPFSALRHWRLMRRLNTLGFDKLLGLRAAYLPCRLAPHVGVITVSTTEDEALVHGGRALQRLWLRATMLQLALQPMAASVVLPLVEAAHVSREAARMLEDGWTKLTPGARPLMLFRLGRVRPPTVRAARKDPASYLCSAETKERTAER